MNGQCWAVFRVCMDLSNQRRFNIYWGSFTGGRGGHISPFIKVMKNTPYILLSSDIFFFNFNGDQGAFGLVCSEKEYSTCGIFLG